MQQTKKQIQTLKQIIPVNAYKIEMSSTHTGKVLFGYLLKESISEDHCTTVKGVYGKVAKNGRVTKLKTEHYGVA